MKQCDAKRQQLPIQKIRLSAAVRWSAKFGDSGLFRDRIPAPSDGCALLPCGPSKRWIMLPAMVRIAANLVVHRLELAGQYRFGSKNDAEFCLNKAGPWQAIKAFLKTSASTD